MYFYHNNTAILNEISEETKNNYRVEGRVGCLRELETLKREFKAYKKLENLLILYQNASMHGV